MGSVGMMGETHSLASHLDGFDQLVNRAVNSAGIHARDAGSSGDTGPVRDRRCHRLAAARQHHGAHCGSACAGSSRSLAFRCSSY